MQITFALAIRRVNKTFPVKSILLAHEICSFYFPVTFVQVTRNPQLWYYMSDQAANGAYLFTRYSGLAGIHILPTVDYGQNMAACQMAVRHEIGHWVSGVRQHSSDSESLMCAQPRISTMWTTGDYAGWFRRFGAPRPGRNPYDRNEHYRWFPKTGYARVSASQPDLYENTRIHCCPDHPVEEEYADHPMFASCPDIEAVSEESPGEITWIE